MENADPPAALYEDTVDVPFREARHVRSVRVSPESEPVEWMVPDGDAISNEPTPSYVSRVALSRGRARTPRIFAGRPSSRRSWSARKFSEQVARRSFVACFGSYRTFTTS